MTAPTPARAPYPPDPAARRRRELARRRRRARIRRNRLFTGLGAALTGVVAWAALGSGGSDPGLSADRAPAVTLFAHLASVHVVPGRLGAFPWPARGEGAVAVLGTGLVAHSPGARRVPIASMTKMMTAYVVLHDHPLAPGQAGPAFVMRAADVAAYVHASQSGDSNVPVRAGERLSEYQLLEALLIPSADNIADWLARWDAGSIRRFVAKMNAAARALGLDSTRYADASGLNPASSSTAADQAILAARVMEIPVVRSIVSRPSARFPVAGTIWNYNPALGSDGIVGVKSGFTSQALGCLAVAAYRRVGNRNVLVLAVTTGQPDGLYGAARVDEQLLGALHGALRLVAPVRTGATVATVELPGSARGVPATVARAPIVVGWPGLVLRARVVPALSLPATPAASSVVGSLELLAGHAVVAASPLEVDGRQPATQGGG